MSDTQECRLCGEQTNVVFNINFTAVPICDECALAITKQEVVSWRPQSVAQEAKAKIDG